MKWTDPDEFPALLLEHHVLTDDINNVGSLLDGLDGAGVKTGGRHRTIVGEPGESDQTFGWHG